MKTDQIIAILNSFGQSLELTGGGHRSNVIKTLAQAFEPVRPLTIAQLSKRIGKELGAPHDHIAGDGDPTLADAIPLLTALQSLLDTAGAKPASKDIAAIRAAIDVSRTAPVEALASALRAPPPLTRQPGSAQSAVVDLALARELADHLTAVNDDDHAFKSLVKDIRARKLNKPTVNAIANTFLGRDRRSPDKTVAQAIKSIEDRHQINALSESRARKIDSINL